MDVRAVMRHLQNDGNIKSWVCQFCGEPFPYDVHPEVIRYHLTSMCERAPEDVKEAVRRSEEDEFSISISVEGNGSNFNAITECSRNAEREVEAAECSISVNWEPTRTLDASEHNDSNSEAEIESNIVPRSNQRRRITDSPFPLKAGRRITDSPFPLKAEGDSQAQVDEAAEEFIKRFYKDLKQQQISAVDSPYHGMWSRLWQRLTR